MSLAWRSKEFGLNKQKFREDKNKPKNAKTFKRCIFFYIDVGVLIMLMIQKKEKETQPLYELT